MRPINDSLSFIEPRDRASLDAAVFDYYAKNSYVRYLDGEEDPETLENKLRDSIEMEQNVNMNECTIKDVRNVHISSDH